MNTMKKKYVYLDNNATTPIHPIIQKLISEKLKRFENPSSMHFYAREVREQIELARESIANLIGANADNILFTSCGSESNNLILKQALVKKSVLGEPVHIITSVIEHPSVLQTCKYLETMGIAVSYIPVDKNGILKIDELEKSIRKETFLVSIMTANNEIGTIQPISEISRIARENKILFHTDAVQAIGKMPINVSEVQVDALTLSGHKFNALKGIGALYVKSGIELEPLIYGGHQENGLRAGTENYIGIISMGKAAELLKDEMNADIKKMKKLRDMLRIGIQESIPDVQINGLQEKCLPSTLNVSFSHVEGESILLYLDLEGIAVSTGSACATGSLEPSYVLTALKIDTALAHGSIRFSFGRDNTEEDVEYVLEKLPSVISKLRKMSPLAGKK
jgi:cysteine desulfurase